MVYKSQILFEDQNDGFTKVEVSFTTGLRSSAWGSTEMLSGYEI